MRKQYDLLIGDKTAEEIKINIGCAYIDPNDPYSVKEMKARGRDIISGLPKLLILHPLMQ